MSSSKRNSGNFLKQGSILALSGIIVRIIGLLYRIPMNNRIGDGGAGIYSIAFDVYSLLLIISSYSLPLAVSKMVSARCIKKEYRNAYKIFKSSLLFAFVSGGIAALILFFGADLIEKLFYKTYIGVAISLRILAPTVFMVAIIGVFRGYYQGKNTMMPTAFSQIIEQLVNAVVSVFGAYALMKAHSASSKINAWGAAGGTLGTALGAFFALLFLLFVFYLYRPTVKRQMRRDTLSEEESYKDIYKILFLTILPVILSQTVYNVSGVIDSSVFGNIMKAKGYTEDAVSALQGIVSGKYRLLINVPIAISTSIAASMVPSIVASFTQGYHREVKGKVQSAVKFNMLIAFPSAIGLSVLGEPIVRMLFTNTDYVLAGNLFKLGSVAIIFYALSTVTSGVLQSINQMRLPVIHSAISLGIHIILVFTLLWFTDLGVYALVIGNVTYPILVCILNWKAVSKYLNYKQEVVKTFLIPFWCSIAMGIVTFLTYKGLNLLLHSYAISVIVAVMMAVIVYFVLILLTKGVSKDELYDLPFGRTFASVAVKLHLI